MEKKGIIKIQQAKAVILKSVDFLKEAAEHLSTIKEKTVVQREYKSGDIFRTGENFFILTYYSYEWYIVNLLTGKEQFIMSRPGEYCLFEQSLKEGVSKEIEYVGRIEDNLTLVVDTEI